MTALDHPADSFIPEFKRVKFQIQPDHLAILKIQEGPVWPDLDPMLLSVTDHPTCNIDGEQRETT